MRNKIILLAIVFQIVLLNLIQSTASQESTENDFSIKISVLGDKELTRFDRMVFIAGVWNWINISFSENVDNLRVDLYKGENIPTSKNKYNYYSWEYSKEWKALSVYDGSDYLDKRNSTKEGLNFSLRVTIENVVEDDYENWTLLISFDGKEKKIPVVMEKPERGIGINRGDYNLRVDPFKIVTLHGDHTFVTENTGNLPLVIDVNYDKYNERINTSNMKIILYPGESIEHMIEIKTMRWRPGFLEIKGTVEARTPESIIPVFLSSLPTIQLKEVFYQTPFPYIKITVGHKDFKLEEKENFTFQYLESTEIYRNEKKIVYSYLCGEGNLTLSIYSENISILNTWVDNTKTFTENIFLNLNSSRETVVKVEIKPDGNSTQGKIIYKLVKNGEVYTYSTKITIKEPSVTGRKEEEGNILPKVLVAIGFMILVIIILVSYLRGRR